MTTLIVRSVLPGTLGTNGSRSIVGHSWIEIHNSNGTVESFGYYPKVSSPYAPGTVKTTDASQFPSVVGSSSQPITITEAQAQAFRDFATVTNQFGTYQLLGNDGSSPFGSYNCASWIASGFKTAGVKGSFPITLIIPWFAPRQFNPLLPSTMEVEGWVISPTVNTTTLAALNWTPPPRDPLVLDLDGDGIETVGITPGSPILFDHDADGLRIGTGWIAPDDGLLVLDINGNGLIDSGRELFGDQTALPPSPLPGGALYAGNGFHALMQRDTQPNQQIDSQDSVFTQLRIWQDANQNGISEAGELKTLASLGITSIGTVGNYGPTGTANFGNGNTQVAAGTFTRSNGATGRSGSLRLSSSNFYREFSDDPAVTTAAQALPQMHGSGLVRDLREAMSLGTPAAQALQTKLAAFSAATTKQAQMALLDDLIAAWGNTITRTRDVADDYPFEWAWSTTGLNPRTGTWYPTFEQQYGAALDARGLNWRGIVGWSNGQSAETRLSNMLIGAGLIKGYGVDGTFQNRTDWHTWSVSASDVYVRDNPAEAAKMRALEAFVGQNVVDRFLELTYGTSNSATALYQIKIRRPEVNTLLGQAYDSLKDSVYSALVMQTRLKPYLDSISLVVDTNGVRFDTTQLVSKLDAKRLAGVDSALLDLVDLDRYLAPTMAVIGLDTFAKMAQWSQSLPANSPVWAELSASGMLTSTVANGTAGNDTYLGNAAANAFNSGSGDDRISGGAGNDTLTGGLGNDTLNGGMGFDTAIFSGLRASYTVTQADGKVTVSGADGVDVLTSIEKLSFTDKNVFIRAAVSDFNADGTSDLLWSRPGTGATTLWTLKNNVKVGNTDLGSLGASGTVQATGDFNGDGTADFIWKNTATGQFNIWNYANGVQSGNTNLGVIGTQWSVMGSGDFNADGTADLVWRDSSTGQLYMWMMQNNAIASSTNLGTIGVDWTVQAVGDFNADGTSDLALRNTSTGQAYIWNFANGVQSGGASLTTAVGTNWSIMGAGDFNADGTDDIAWRNNTDGTLYLWMLQNNAVSASSNLGVIGTAWTIDAISNVNADATSDMLLKNTTTGQFYVWNITNGAVSGSADLGVVGADWQINTALPNDAPTGAPLGASPDTLGSLSGKLDITNAARFRSSDGNTSLDSQVQNLVSAMAGFAPPAAGQTTLFANYTTALVPVLATNWV